MLANTSNKVAVMREHAETTRNGSNAPDETVQGAQDLTQGRLHETGHS